MTGITAALIVARQTARLANDKSRLAMLKRLLATALIATTAVAAIAAGAQAANPGGRTSHPRAAEWIALAEWSKAENRAQCAPLVFRSEAGLAGTPRRAEFSGGWAVAYDVPGLRSAYGVAGTGLLPADRNGAHVHRARLMAQWPHFREIRTLPAPSFAGYGLSGAEPYPSDNPQGNGLHSLAYLRVGGQTCLYNVWSRISRAHLETLLSNLRVVDTRQRR